MLTSSRAPALMKMSTIRQNAPYCDWAGPPEGLLKSSFWYLKRRGDIESGGRNGSRQHKFCTGISRSLNRNPPASRHCYSSDESVNGHQKVIRGCLPPRAFPETLGWSAATLCFPGSAPVGKNEVDIVHAQTAPGKKQGTVREPAGGGRQRPHPFRVVQQRHWTRRKHHAR